MRLDEKSSAGFAVISWHDQLYLAWTGSDMRINLAYSPDGSQVAGKQRLDHRSCKQEAVHTGETSSTRTVSVAPSLAVSGGRLYLAWRGTNAALNLLPADQPANYAPVTLKERSGNAPSLAASDGENAGELVLSWTGTDRHVNLLAVGHDPYLVPPGTLKTRLEQARTADGPAVCYHQDSLALAWTGTDRHVNILAQAANPSGPPLRLDMAKTGHAPALCSYRGSLALAWTGTDRRVNVMLDPGGPNGSPVQLDGARTREAPALCSHQDGLVVAWSGTDRRLNLTRLP